MASQSTKINQRLDKVSTNYIKANFICENCAIYHKMVEFPRGGTFNFEQIAYLGNSNWKNNPYSNNYNLG